MPEVNFKAILGCKCPKCLKGNLFLYSAYKPFKFNLMSKNCPKCGQVYEIEPGFFYGAMFVSYGFAVILTVIIGVSTYLVFNDPLISIYLLNIGIVSLILLPINFRLARSFYIHLVSGIKYQGDQEG